MLLVDENDEIWTKLFENDMNNLKYRPLSLDDEQGDSDTTGSSLRDSMNSNSLDQMDTFSDIPADLELGDDARQDSQWISNNSLTANLVPIGEAEENLTSSSPSSYEWFDKTHPRVVPKSKLASERALQYSKGPIILYSDVKSISIANGSDLHLGLDGIKNSISMNSGFDRICMKLWIPELALAVMASQVGILVFLRIIKSAEGDLGIVVEMIYEVSATILGLSSMKVESCTRKSLYKVYCLTYEQKMLSFNVYT